MNLREKFSTLEHTGTDWRRLLIRGSLMLFIGVALVAGTLIKHDVIIFQVRGFSWLPICGIVVLAVGLLECFDAAVAKELGDFFLNLQTGVLDVVVGGLILFSIGGDPARLSLLIAAFLIVKGIFRLTLASVTQIPNRVSTFSGCGTVYCPWYAYLAGMAFLGRMVFGLLPERRDWAARMGHNDVWVLD